MYAIIDPYYCYQQDGQDVISFQSVETGFFDKDIAVIRRDCLMKTDMYTNLQVIEYP